MNNASNRKEIAFGMFGFYITVQFALYSQFHSVGLLVGWFVRWSIILQFFVIATSSSSLLRFPFVVILWKMIFYLNVLLLSRLVARFYFIYYTFSLLFSAWHFCTKYQMSSGSGTKYDAPDCIHIYTQKINCFV